MWLVSKGIIDAHGGLLSVYSAGESRGSTFTIELNLPEARKNLRLARHTSDIYPITPKNFPRVQKRTRFYDVTYTILRRLYASYSYAFFSEKELRVKPLPIDNINVEIRKPSVALVMPARDNTSFNSISRTCKLGGTDHDIMPTESKDDVERSYNLYNGINVPQLKRERSLKLADPIKMLIVDDSNVSRDMLVRLMQRKCICDEAEDGTDAVRMVQSSMEKNDPYSIILMDSEMKNMNGLEATRHIRDKLGYEGIIIGVTGNALPEDIFNFKAHGANDVLVKPIRVGQLDELVMRLHEY